jgi:uncharacterized protein
MEPDSPSQQPSSNGSSGQLSGRPIEPAGSEAYAANAAQDPEPRLVPQPRPFRWVFYGGQGLRAGWSTLAFILLVVVFSLILGTVFSKLHLTGGKGDFSPRSGLFGELAGFVAIVGAAAIMARLERRRIRDYNLTGPRRTLRFLSGIVVGFAALSCLVGALDLGGWLHFGPQALSGAAILKYALIWGCTFLLVGFVEEGVMRCYLLFTLARGINIWWSLGLVAAMCLSTALRTKGLGAWGVYGLALLGVFPCLALAATKAKGAGFWYAAWVTSTFFAFGHTGNKGEDWIGIFAAGAVGFVFCVSVKLTGSAWWAIGCHAGWDWAETYFYGTPDSGLVPKGHYLTTTTSGPALWSGGAVGPEGSVLVVGVILLLLIYVIAVYGRKSAQAQPAQALEQAVG